MARNESHVEEARATKRVLDAVLREAPRDDEGELKQPYRGWVRLMQADLERWKGWVGKEKAKLLEEG